MLLLKINALYLASETYVENVKVYRSFFGCKQTCNLKTHLSSSTFLRNISNTSDSVSSGYPNTEKRVENTTRSGVFLTKFEVFG